MRSKYFCLKCKENHYYDSKIGIMHNKILESVKLPVTKIKVEFGNDFDEDGWFIGKIVIPSSFKLSQNDEWEKEWTHVPTGNTLTLSSEPDTTGMGGDPTWILDDTYNSTSDFIDNNRFLDAMKVLENKMNEIDKKSG